MIEADTRHRLLLSGVVAVACTVLLLATSPKLPMGWDEGSAISRSQGIIHWARRWLPDNDGLGPFSKKAIAEDWLYTTRIEGHPAFFGIVIAMGRWIGFAWLPPLESYRLGPILLFGAAAGALFYRMTKQYSLVAGIGAVTALMLLPRMFAHAHFALYDGTLTACWIITWATFAPARQSWLATVGWGAALGMTLSSKATGWIAPVPFLAWAIAYRDRRALAAMGLGIPVAMVTFYLLNPSIWHAPVQGFFDFLQLNTNRAANPGLNISTWFLGRMYNLDFPLPWFNSLFWTLVTVPVGLLFLFGIGLAAVLRDPGAHRAGVLLVFHWVSLLVVRALPLAPPHDGVRLFLPSFAFLAAIAGLGTYCVWHWCAHRGRVRRVLASTGLAALYVGSATSLVWYSPQWLSYYNLVIGGLPGATHLGMEPTYYWDALDRSTVDWLHQNTQPDQRILFGPIPSERVQAGPMENLRWMQHWGRFRRHTEFEAPGQFRWYVIQHRPSGMWPVDHWLVENRPPSFQKKIRSGGWGPWRLNVPLVSVYEFADFVEGQKATSR
jgi:hypothetical protein